MGRLGGWHAFFRVIWGLNEYKECWGEVRRGGMGNTHVSRKRRGIRKAWMRSLESEVRGKKNETRGK